ncbi:hypothetical protein E4U53_000426 [Claviceps sorghi]|nr:hypothetical protein E4U53_000426 [Claviceps sorghi]
MIKPAPPRGQRPAVADASQLDTKPATPPALMLGRVRLADGWRTAGAQLARSCAANGKNQTVDKCRCSRPSSPCPRPINNPAVHWRGRAGAGLSAPRICGIKSTTFVCPSISPRAPPALALWQRAESPPPEAPPRVPGFDDEQSIEFGS